MPKNKLCGCGYEMDEGTLLRLRNSLQAQRAPTSLLPEEYHHRRAHKCIPIFALSKRGRDLEISGRVASFLRRYPAVFEEFRGTKHKLPCFRLTQELIDVDQEEREIYLMRGLEIVSRLRRLILMSKSKMLPLRFSEKPGRNF